jgi:ribosome recycling factor
MAIDLAVKQRFEQVFSHLSNDLKTVKTGRAKPSLVEDILIEAYGTRMHLKELASLSAPDPHQIIISPWDKSLLEAISRGVNAANLNLNAIVDGELIRINIPPLTAETREQLVKLVRQKLESAKVMLRQVRAEAKREIEGQKEKGGVSEDTIHLDLENLQKMVEEYEEKLESLAKNKEEELIFSSAPGAA